MDILNISFYISVHKNFDNFVESYHRHSICHLQRHSRVSFVLIQHLINNKDKMISKPLRAFLWNIVYIICIYVGI